MVYKVASLNANAHPETRFSETSTGVLPGRHIVSELPVFDGNAAVFKVQGMGFAVKLALVSLKLAGPDSEGNYGASFLSGNARVWLITSLDTADSYPDWDGLKDALCDTCGPRYDREKARIRMFSVC